MRYANARARIGDGDVLAWRGRSLIGRLIRAWTGETYSHVALAIWMDGRLMAIEAAEGRGVVIRPLSKRLPAFWLHIPNGNGRVVLSRALRRLGETYSYLDALRAGLGFAPRSGGWQCAEFVMAAIEPGAPAFARTPGAVVNYLLTCGARLERLEAA